MRQDSDSRRHARFALRIEASEINTRSVVQSVCGRLRLAGVAPLRAGDIEIVLAEAINNVVEHAYGQSEPGPIHISCSLRNDRLDIRINDEGRPLPDERLPPGRVADVDVPLNDLPEGGFGWFLIRSLATEVRYDRCGTRNQLSLRFKV
ncbi:ATP-binding protein [Jhaorihella thermophila]|uniref:ATP-binding protein n=1 Tax=Jhaorihella thermophila TaxID=488547 RepID=UPI000CDE6A93|nr:ATP-binding protein [Jhaorihella thermophila]